MQAAARPALLLLLALPCGAAAADLVSLEYEGTITETVGAPPEYVVGDRIAGRLLIDRQLARPRSDSPARVTYESDNPDFVRGFWRPGGDGFDRVFVGDELSVAGIDKPIDVFSAEDWFVLPNASLDSASVFGLHARLYDFLAGTSLDQSFELTSADVDEPHESLTGSFRFSNIGPFERVSFVLDRLSVKPKVCAAPRAKIS